MYISLNEFNDLFSSLEEGEGVGKGVGGSLDKYTIPEIKEINNN